MDLFNKKKSWRNATVAMTGSKMMNSFTNTRFMKMSVEYFLFDYVDINLLSKRH